jgi:serine protease inhibitor
MLNHIVSQRSYIYINIQLICCAIAVFASGFIGCSNSPVVNQPTKPTSLPPTRTLSANETSVLNSSNEFAWKALAELTKSESPNDNIVFSPFSITEAMMMTANGAQGDTQKEILSALEQQDLDISALNQTAKELRSYLLSLDPDVSMSIANSIWIRDGFPVNPSFTDVNSSFYSADVKNLDFSKSGAGDIINTWIENNTNNRIKKMLSSNIGSNVMMYIINAVFFKAPWSVKFNPANTKPSTFASPKGDIPCNMMFTGLRAKFVQGAGYTALELPYANKRFAMTVIIENNMLGAPTVPPLNAKLFNQLRSQMKSDSVEVFLPRFTLEYGTKELNDMLKALGVNKVFDAEQADLTGINSTAKLSVSSVKHKAFIQVNEEGTEASAATVVEIVETSIPVVPILRFDKPFTFVIHDIQNGSILFMGKLNQPIE